MKSIKETDKQESVLTELNDCFKIVSVNILPSERGVYITDNKVQCRLVIESLMPKDVLCNKAAICVDSVKQDKTPVKTYKTDLTVGKQSSSPRKSNIDNTDSDSNNLVTR